MVKIPKRNKSKDNPYTLAYDDIKDKYYVEFVDVKKIFNRIQLTKEQYEAFDSFELEDISQIHKYRSHIEHSELTDASLENRKSEETITVEKIVEDKLLFEELYKYINDLPDIQRKRIIKYFFEEKTYDCIAKEEGCTKSAVKFSIDIAIKNISKKFKL